MLSIILFYVQKTYLLVLQRCCYKGKYFEFISQKGKFSKSYYSNILISPEYF
jgi:hypothetical protein